jgi:hypothetical protein
MTVNVRPADMSIPRDNAAAAWSDSFAFPLTIAALLLIYGLLQNACWIPSGDSEVYISIARNLARGDGYVFNGQPVAMVPPGWPLAMAILMKITPYFLPLKLFAMSCMIGFFACGYWIVRRFASPNRTVAIILLTAMLSVVYPATYWLISEGLFCVLSAAALLLAMRIGEKRDAWWRIVLMSVLCAAAVSVRWAGVINMLLIAAALLQGELKPRVNRQWIALAICSVLTIGTFFALRHVLTITPEQATAAAEFGGTGEDSGAAGDTDVTLTDRQVASQYKLITGTANSDGYGQRLINWGRWFAFLYWQPFRAAVAFHALSLLCNGVGWIVILLLGMTALFAARRRQWLWLALLMYTGGLALNWPNINARYLVPVSFLLTLGIFLAADHLVELARDNALFRRCAAGALYLFVAVTLLCNLALYALEVSVQRSREVYRAYEAGLHQNLIASAKFLSGQGVADGTVAISSRYQNLGRTRSSPYALRAMTMLTGKAMVPVPFKLTGPPSTALRRWLFNHHIDWYVYEPPVSPWRIGHLRMAWVEQKLTGVPPPLEDQAGFKLYRVDDDKMPEVQPPPTGRWPTRVPGL